ncbi:hypothetical protein [Streptomyces specialis]|uniref:hypothetical protein n=1 Tax=Streptomyces specialis TaxID=498367 RepID=UPI00073F9712|nr:hypothetical protein [Streptomyces specialis]
MRKRVLGVAAATAATVLGGLATAAPAHATGHGPGNYGVWASNVNVRDNWGNPAACENYPSPTNCPNVLVKLSPPAQVYVQCQTVGQTVGGNPYWVRVFVSSASETGYMASYYIDNATNWIDGVPAC